MVEVVPYKMVGAQVFGTTRDQVRMLLDGGYRTFMRAGIESCDYVEKDGTFFYFDEKNELAAIEFGGPIRPVVKSLDLLGLRFSEAVKLLSVVDQHLELEADSAISYHLGVSIYASAAVKEPTTAKVESILAFRRGYYD